MYTYHVYGNIYQEEYYFVNDYTRYFDGWNAYSYYIYTDITSEEIFERIKQNNVDFYTLDKPKAINISKYICRKKPILLKRFIFAGTYKEIAVIETDIELRDNETIHIEGKDYNVKYVFNSDTKQHELYINKIVETIVDQELLKHAKKVCNEVIKKILRYNKEIDKQGKLKDKDHKKIRIVKNNKIDSLENKKENISLIDKLKTKVRKLIEF